jgi:hypothetical protein
VSDSELRRLARLRDQAAEVFRHHGLHLVQGVFNPSDGERPHMAQFIVVALNDEDETSAQFDAIIGGAIEAERAERAERARDELRRWMISGE